MRIFRYDKKKNTLVAQSVIMIIIAATMFFQYYFSKQLLFLVLMALALVFVAIYFYRIFFMRIVFEDDKVTFKGLTKRYAIDKKDILGVELVRQNGKEIEKTKYTIGSDCRGVADKSYVLIARNESALNNVKLSMFNAASNNHILLEYVPGIEKYLDKLVEK